MSSAQGLPPLLLLLLLLLLPCLCRYGPQLRDIDPAAFEQMRLVLGYYDLPENRSKPRPPLPTHVTINNMQVGPLSSLLVLPVQMLLPLHNGV
jgi:hypothetical protein